MKILFCGDVVGRAGRDAVVKYVPLLREEHKLDFIIVSGDNAAAGFGITPDICEEFFKLGVDVITGGDHVWDQKDMLPYLSQEKRVLRPHNFPDTAPGSGMGIYTARNGKKVAVLHLLGQVFHREYLDSPFPYATRMLQGMTLGGSVAAIIMDFHAEATSEKTAMGHHLDGKVSMVVGSHTHIPTADARVMSSGTAYITDAGMCGDYDSVIGFDPAGPMTRFTAKMHKTRMEPGKGEGTLCGVIVETDDKTGLALSITQLKLGGVLA